jgi:hypothetical protein
MADQPRIIVTLGSDQQENRTIIYELLDALAREKVSCEAPLAFDESSIPITFFEPITIAIAKIIVSFLSRRREVRINAEFNSGRSLLISSDLSVDEVFRALSGHLDDRTIDPVDPWPRKTKGG